jgi:hypothetical protein
MDIRILVLCCPRCNNEISTPLSTAAAWCNNHLGNSVPMKPKVAS